MRLLANSALAIVLGKIRRAAAAASQSASAGRVDLRAEFNRLGLIPQVQGADTCSLHAVASLAEFELARRDPRPNSERSTEFLIWAAKKATGKDHDQAMFYEAVCGLNRFGICHEGLMPRSAAGHAGKPHRRPPWPTPSSKATAGRSTGSNAGTSSGRWTTLRSQAIKEALAHGHPVACGLRGPRSSKVPS